MVPSFRLPARYELLAQLGRGGGGEVWAVRDRVDHRRCALKVLAADAGQAEALALVHEAVTLSGLEGLGVPRVLGFGCLPGTARTFLVRELVDGRSLEEVLADPSPLDARTWLEPLASAIDQLTILHRAGLLHGDIKPANVIVTDDKTGTLVDLGLATQWREGGTKARGLSPRYAAPEVRSGTTLTVRSEVYSVGATLAEALELRRGDLDDRTLGALLRICARATEPRPEARYPSIDELASALKSAANLETKAIGTAWPVLGIEAAAKLLTERVLALGKGEILCLSGPRRSGRSTLLRRLAWTLGVMSVPVVDVPAETDSGMTARDVLEAACEEWLVAPSGERSLPGTRLLVTMDDIAMQKEDARAALRDALQLGARLVVVGDRASCTDLGALSVVDFDVPPLDGASSKELIQRAMPSLADRLAERLIQRAEGRPGTLRSMVDRLEGHAITSEQELDALLDSAAGIADDTLSLEQALDTGRFDRAAELLARRGPAESDDERVSWAVAMAKVHLARGHAAEAAAVLDAAPHPQASVETRRTWTLARARTHVRLGEYTSALALTEPGESVAPQDALAAEALAVRGLALAFVGEEPRGRSLIEHAITLAQTANSSRVEAISHVSLAIAYQRAGRARDARLSYEAALSSAERARDASTLATARLNLAGIAKADGDLAQALGHFEAALDMGRRSGGLVVVQQALLNLANLDLYLGRYAKAAASIERLATHRETLAPHARAQLWGLEAELASRLGETDRAAEFYARSAEAYSSVGRPVDAAESQLESMLMRLGGRSSDAVPNDDGIQRELDALGREMGTGGFKEHEAIAEIVRGMLAMVRGDDAAARGHFDSAIKHATSSGQHEWLWRAFEARGKLAASQGASALARRDTDEALALLEQTAAKLPRDLREVFWNDPRRSALRQAHASTHFHTDARSTFPTGNEGAPYDSSGLGRWNGTAPFVGSSRTSLGTPMPAEDRLQRIFEITRDLAHERDVERLLERVTEYAVGLLRAERGWIVLTNEQGELVARARSYPQSDEAHQSFSRSIAERVIREGEPVIATSAGDDARLASAVSVHKLRIQSVACVPIRGAPPAGETIGALYLETRLRPNVRFKDELPTLAAFADQAAIAIENARLVEELKRRSSELQQTNKELADAKARLAERLSLRKEQLASARRDLKQVRQELSSHFGYAGIVGTSAAMRKVYALLERIRGTDVPVLITGESGTGKEVIAKAIHATGPRSRAPFLGVNCGAIPAALLESELFGHVRGAFTGADRDRKGLFQEAERGTIMLDEIGEMPLKMQAGLLRVLQERAVRPVGAVTESPCDARVIAATNRGLAAMVAEGTFREDLFYRLNVIELKIPPLRERTDDIPALVDHFLTVFAARHGRPRRSIDRDAMRRLQAYEWPGNVRQLEHTLLNAWLLCDGEEIMPGDIDLPAAAKRASTTQTGASSPRPGTKSEFVSDEKAKILDALAKAGWNRVQAAKLLGIPRRTLYRRLHEYGIV
jgi:serine/threonine-protein kinase PknK